MNITKAKHIYGFDIATLMQAFKDDAFIEKKMASGGAKDIDISVTNNDNGFDVLVKRQVPANIPAALKSYVGDWNLVTQKERWTGNNDTGYQCNLTIEIENLPVDISGSMQISSQSILTNNNVKFEISCPIPLFGSKVEDFVAANIARSAQAEFEFIKEALG